MWPRRPAAAAAPAAADPAPPPAAAVALTPGVSSSPLAEDDLPVGVDRPHAPPPADPRPVGQPHPRLSHSRLAPQADLQRPRRLLDVAQPFGHVVGRIADD